MVDPNKSISPTVFLLPLLVLMMGFAMITSMNSSHVIYGQSYETGIPEKSEISYGTHKIFRQDVFTSEVIRSEEQWEWSDKDKKDHEDPESRCGHIYKWRHPDDPSKPYEAQTYENYSKVWRFATLQEAEEFVTRWCKP
jgi:hypothetical protein